VVFFNHNHTTLPPVLSVSIASPYLIGFNHSRQNETGAFTTGPTNYPELRDYQHADYVTKKVTTFRPEFDFFSLGIVLLEIGIWRTLDQMTDRVKQLHYSPRELLEYILRDYVPLLRYYKGEKYMNATKTCLSGAFLFTDRDNRSTVALEAELDRTSLLLRFEQMVVLPLSQCSV
jgi:hypothetical protein